MEFKIKAPRASLCENCSHAFRVHDHDGRLALCLCQSAYGKPVGVPEVVKTCTQYDFKFDSAHQFKDKAWVMEVKPTREFIGFRPPKQRKEEES